MNENQINEVVEKFGNTNNNNSKSDYFSLKKTKDGYMISTNRFNIKDEVTVDNLFKNESIGSRTRKRSSIKMQVNNKDHYRFIRSLSQISNLANYDFDHNRQTSALNLPKEMKLEMSKDDQIMKVPSFSNFNVEADMEINRLRGISNVSANEFSFLQGTRNQSKRNSLISNISALFNKDDN
jgi:hypothetical protein